MYRNVRHVKPRTIKRGLDFTRWRRVGYDFSDRPKCLLSPDNWTKFPIYRIEKESHDVLRIRLRLPTKKDSHGLPINSEELGLPIASCVTFRGFSNHNSDSTTTTSKEKKEIIRPYTPVSDNAMKGFVEFVIKIYENGEMTQYLSSLTENDYIEMKGPWSKIEYPFSDKSELAMICGGSGITPMIQVLKEMCLNNNIDQRGVTMLNANKSETDKICNSDLLQIKTIMKDRFYCWDIFENTKSNDIALSSWNPNVAKIGRIDEKLLKEYLPAPSDDTLIMICGPDPMVDAIAGGKVPQEGKPPAQGPVGGMLKNLGYTQDMVYKF